MKEDVKLIGLLSVLLATWTAAEDSQESQSCGVAPAMIRVRRIINGQKTHSHQFPWMVSIQVEGEHICGGALIENDVVLTAAHCVSPDPRVTVVAGVNNLADKGVHINGTTIVHPRYNVNQSLVSFDELHYDVALVHLDRPVHFSHRIQPICLPDQDDGLRVGSVAYLAGWGTEDTEWDRIVRNQSLHRDGSTPPPTPAASAKHTLKQMTLKIADYKTCNRDMQEYTAAMVEGCARGEFPSQWCDTMRANENSSDIPTSKVDEDGSGEELPPSPFCAVTKMDDGVRRAICNGDSGGPLMMKTSDENVWYVAGIVSWGIIDCVVRLESFSQPSFFSDVRHWLSWIQATIAETRSAVRNKPEDIVKLETTASSNAGTRAVPLGLLAWPLAAGLSGAVRLHMS